MNGEEFSGLLDLKLKNLNDCVVKIDSKLDAHLDWHHEEMETAHKVALAAVEAAKQVAEAALKATRDLRESRRWETWKIFLVAFLSLLTGGTLAALIKIF